MGPYFALHDHNICTPEVETFLADLLEHLPHGLIAMLDRSQPHRSAARRLLGRFPRRLWMEWLPPYAPELNPDEQVWTRTKHTDLANFIPENINELGQAIEDSFEETKMCQPLLRSFFQHAKLEL